MGRMPARRRRWAIQRGDGPHGHVAQHAHGQAGAEVEGLHRRRGGALDGPAAGAGQRWLGSAELESQASGQVAGDTDHVPGIGPVALDGQVEDHVVHEAQGLHERGAGLARCLLAQDQQTRGVVGEAQLGARAQHAVGDDALHLAPTDLEAARQDGADRGQRDPVPHLEVVGAADDLDRLLEAGVDQDAPDLVGALDGRDLEDPADHDVGQPLPDVLDALDDQSEVVERGAQHPDVAGELRKVTEPAEWSAQRGILVWVSRVRTG